MSDVSQGVVFVVDDDEAVRDALQRLFESVDLKVMAYPSGQDFLENLPSESPGCLITDIRMPSMSGMELQKELAARSVNLPIVMITGHGDVETGIRAMKAGAFDFIQKPFNDQQLLEVVNLALERNIEEIKRDEDLQALRKLFDTLSNREREVLDLIVDGVPNKRIADRLGLSDKTVEFHRANIMKKMQAKTLAELIRRTLALKPV